MDSHTLSVESLSSGYGKHEILHDVDFTAGSGITAVIGANGSGKSTLLKSICGVCDNFGGRVLYGAQDITGLSTHRIMKSGISYMPQRDNIFSDLSVLENLIIANLPDTPDWDYVFDFFPELKSFGSKKANNLSGGQRQLLALAMCLQKKPGMMLFDEPTANLSPKAAQLVFKKIRQMQEELSNCVVLVEQNVQSALKICDRVCLFASGKIIFDGEPKALLSDKNMIKRYLGVDCA